MAHLAHRRWLKVFLAVAFLVLLQLAWWTTVFVSDVDKMAALRQENNQLRSALNEPILKSAEAIQDEVFHRRFMFLSESVVFGFLTIVGFFLLYGALKAEEKAAELQKNFIEVVTHESKTPLTALKLRLESVIERWGKASDLRKELESSLLEVRRLSSTFEKVLSLNRIERGAFHFELVDLKEVTESVLRRVEPLARAADVELQAQVSQPCIVMGDVSALQSAVQGLVENAIYHQSGEHRRVDVELRPQGENFVLSVADQGVPIPEEERERIFEKFFRGKRSKKVPGSGLGLSIAKQIADAHAGWLRLEVGPGLGNRFELILRGSAT